VATAALWAGDACWDVAEIYSIDAGSGETKCLFMPLQEIAVSC
jgi:hypothetical protein